MIDVPVVFKGMAAVRYATRDDESATHDRNTFFIQA